MTMEVEAFFTGIIVGAATWALVGEMALRRIAHVVAALI